MSLRNSIVKVFGLKTGNSKQIEKASYYPVGSRAMLFTVVNRNDNEIVMGENDKHLNFRTSVLLDRKADDTTDIYLTTLVHYNNLLGKTYFFFVKPFHRMLLKSQMKNMM